MRALYLVRHGEPDFTGNEGICLGRKDLPLSERGRDQAFEAGRYLKEVMFHSCLYSSPLIRCRQTADYISEVYCADDQLIEIDMGDWTGINFGIIKEKYPECFEERGKDPLGAKAPGGESFLEVEDRSIRALNEILTNNPYKDIVITAHGGVNRCLLKALKHEETLPETQAYGSITALLIDENNEVVGGYEGREAASLPWPVPDENTCIDLLKEYGTPSKVVDHCKAVAKKALELAEIQKEKGIVLDKKVILAAGLLHDMARVQRSHARTAAAFLADIGYTSIAAIVGDHMDLPSGEENVINEKTCVFLADKLVKGSKEVSLYDRYFLDMPDYKKPYAKAKYERALVLHKLFLD